MISDMDDTELIMTICGDQIVEIRKSDYPTHLVGRFINAPDEILDELTSHRGQFEWVLDEPQPV